jgi:hypothetical protein
MKSGMKVLALLALVASLGVAGDTLQAACSEANITAIYPIGQCGSRSWFAPPPAGAGAVSASWWQIGFGNNAIRDGRGALGTAFQIGAAGGGFIGNDNGLVTTLSGLDIGDAGVVGGPAGALCVGATGSANWSINGLDGCSDNQRTLTGPYGYSKNDDILNPYFASGVPAGGGVGIYSTAYQIDAPMAILLTESTGKSFALAMFASRSRNQSATDTDTGSYDMRTVIGDPNPTKPGIDDVIPWQPVPNPTIAATLSNPSDPASPRILNMNWTGVRLVTDNSTRPSSDTTMPVPGVGVNDQGPLVRYAVDIAPITTPPDCGAFTTALSTNNTSATVTNVPQNSCVRLTTHFGRTPATTAVSSANAANGRLGDLGYNVASPTILVGGSLVGNKLVIDSAVKKGGDILISFHTGAELGNPSFVAHGLSANGKDSALGSVPCTACTSGLGGSYTITASGKGGVKSVYILSSTGEKSNTMDVK